MQAEIQETLERIASYTVKTSNATHKLARLLIEDARQRAKEDEASELLYVYGILYTYGHIPIVAAHVKEEIDSLVIQNKPTE